MIDDPNEMGGGALLIGFLLVLVVLYRNPARGLDGATVGAWSVLYFLVLPLGGVLAGVNTSVGGPYGAVPLFVFGSYLGIVGLALALGTLLALDPSGIFLGIGLVQVALSVVALVASGQWLAASVQFGSPQRPPD